ncbi:MAG: AAA family ATPase [Candidatus Pacearchaeota archaeon]
MLFKRIKVENIRSYESAEIVFPKGSVLLSGDIGSGKTSILLALEFALFGLQPGKKGDSILKNGKSEGMVELELEIEGEQVIICRTLKRKKSVSQESAFITIDGKKQELSVTELKNFILRLINYPPEFAKKTNLLYRFTVYTPQEEMKQIILETPEVRLNTLRHVFGIDKYKRIKENTMILTARLRELTRLKQGQISDLELLKSSLDNKKQLLSELKKQIPIIESQLLDAVKSKEKKQEELNSIKEKIDEKRKLESEIEKSSIMYSTKKEQILKIDKEISVINERFKQAKEQFDLDKFNAILKELDEKKKIHENLNREIIESSAKIYNFISKINELQKSKDKIFNLTKCPTCLQEVGTSHKKAFLTQTENEMSEINNLKINLDNEKQEKEIKLRSILIEIRELEKSKLDLEAIKIKIQTIEEDYRKCPQFETQKKSLEYDAGILKDQVERLKTAVSELKKYDNLMLAKEAELNLSSVNERQIEIKRAEIIKEAELQEKDIFIKENQIAEKEKIKTELIYVSGLEEFFSGRFLEMVSSIEKNVMIKLRTEFSGLFNEWFSILVPDTFIVSLNEEFTPIIEQQEYEIDYSYLSGGERTAIALAYRLALNQTITSMLSEIKTKGLVILDEPTDGFSQQQLDKMRDVLEQLDYEQLILVSHDQKIESFVDNVIRLNKEHGISKVGF